MKNSAMKEVFVLSLNISIQAGDLTLFRKKLFIFQQQRVTEVQRLQSAIQIHTTKRCFHLPTILIRLTAVLMKQDLKLL